MVIRIRTKTMRLLTSRQAAGILLIRQYRKTCSVRFLNAGIQAPTGGNLQPVRSLRWKIRKPAPPGQGSVATRASLPKPQSNLVFCIDWRRLERWASLEAAPFSATQSFRHFWISFQDTIICAQNICTAADAVGLGSCYVGTVLECFPRPA